MTVDRSVDIGDWPRPMPRMMPSVTIPSRLAHHLMVSLLFTGNQHDVEVAKQLAALLDALDTAEIGEVAGSNPAGQMTGVLGPRWL